VNNYGNWTLSVETHSERHLMAYLNVVHYLFVKSRAVRVNFARVGPGSNKEKTFSHIVNNPRIFRQRRRYGVIITRREFSELLRRTSANFCEQVDCLFDFPFPEQELSKHVSTFEILITKDEALSKVAFSAREFWWTPLKQVRSHGKVKLTIVWFCPTYGSGIRAALSTERDW